MQLVYFNDLHKNLGCNRGITSKISIIPVTFPVLPVKLYALRLLPAPPFPCAISPAASNSPVKTDISIAQKTCEFMLCDISVAAAKCNKLIYQSVYSRLGGAGGGTPSVCSLRSQLPSPRAASSPSQSKPAGFASSLWEGASGETGYFAVQLGGADDLKWPPLALWPSSAERLFLFRVCRALRSAPNAFSRVGS